MERSTSIDQMERLNFLVLQIQQYIRYLNKNPHCEELSESEKKKIEEIRAKMAKLSAELSALVRNLNYNAPPSIKALY